MDETELERYAAQLEFEQAGRDRMEAWADVVSSPAYGWAECAYVSVVGYESAAGRAVSKARKPREHGAAYWINMKDGIPGRRSTANGSVYRKGTHS